MKKIILILALAFPLSGCLTSNGPASISGGECKVFLSPQYAVKGKTSYDQGYIDDVVESGVSACGWPRPAVRPKEFDAPKNTPRIATERPKKEGFIQRTKKVVRAAVPWPRAKPEPLLSQPVFVPLREDKKPDPDPLGDLLEEKPQQTTRRVYP